MQSAPLCDPLGQPVERVGTRTVNRDEILDALPGPVNVALVFVDRAQLAIIEKNRAISMAVEPGAKPFHRISLVFLVAFNQKIRLVAGERALGTLKHSE